MNPRKPAFDPEAFLLATNSQKKKLVEYRRGENIFSQGEPADAVFYLHKGRVKLTVVSKQGKEAVIGVLGIGDFFGEACIASQGVRMATAIAITPCSVVRIEKPELIRLLHEEPAFLDFFIRSVLSRTTRIEDDLADQLFNPTEKRLARALLLLAGYGREGEPGAVAPKISHEVLAEIVGTTRPRVTYFMNKFRKLGFIEYNGDLRVKPSLCDVVQHD